MIQPGEPIIKRPPALAEQVTSYISARIEDGTYSPGEPLPAESELAKQLDVSRTVVREALARMKHDGLLETRKGTRTRVAEDPSGLVFRLPPEAARDKDFLRHFYELRVIIEPEAAALAAIRANPADLRLVRTGFDRLRKALETDGHAAEESRAFHRALLSASGNPHLAELLGWVEMKLWSFVHAHDIAPGISRIEAVQKEHEDIVRAIEKSDPVEARRISREHVIGAAKRHGLELELPD